MPGIHSICRLPASAPSGVAARRHQLAAALRVARQAAELGAIGPGRARETSACRQAGRQPERQDPHPRRALRRAASGVLWLPASLRHPLALGRQTALSWSNCRVRRCRRSASRSRCRVDRRQPGSSPRRPTSAALPVGNAHRQPARVTAPRSKRAQTDRSNIATTSTTAGCGGRRQPALLLGADRQPVGERGRGAMRGSSSRHPIRRSSRSPWLNARPAAASVNAARSSQVADEVVAEAGGPRWRRVRNPPSSGRCRARRRGCCWSTRRIVHGGQPGARSARIRPAPRRGREPARPALDEQHAQQLRHAGCRARSVVSSPPARGDAADAAAPAPRAIQQASRAGRTARRSGSRCGRPGPRPMVPAVLLRVTARRSARRPADVAGAVSAQREDPRLGT